MPAISTAVSTNRLSMAFGRMIGLALVAATLFLACAYSWTREFVPPEKGEMTSIEGWIFEPDVGAFRHVGDYEPLPDWHRFWVGVTIEYEVRSKKKPVSPITYLTMPESLWVVFRPSGERHRLVQDHATCLSYWGEDDIKRIFTFRRPDEDNITIPHGVDTIDIQFDALVGPGRHVFYERYSIARDSITPLYPDSVLQAVPVSLRLIRHEKSSRIPSFLLWGG